jgi:hypothetical protein
MYYRQSYLVAMATAIDLRQKWTISFVPSCIKIQVRFPVAWHSKKTTINKSEARSLSGTLTFQQVILG